ncbi:MAG: pantoate--beta-alanine ligase [Candidatus Latescibacterota bacterium]|nr:pantoate--beta-alanine ligase [Candidatus Latescibacterota bacterium]
MSKPEIIDTVEIMQVRSANWRSNGLTIALVPTMGYLHSGHLSLIKRAREMADRCIVSIFVNPLQFGPNEDFSRYPRNIENDVLQLSKCQVDATFIPSLKNFYPSHFSTTVDVNTLTEGLCGTNRPGHFRGVTTVISKLFNTCSPHVAVFGQKDYQQAMVIERMTQDLNWDIDIEITPTVRELDGLAMSSRNANLNKKERDNAPMLYKALCSGQTEVINGERSATQIQRIVHSFIKEKLTDQIDYVDVIDTKTLEKIKKIDRSVVIAAAVRMSKARLIDNIMVHQSDWT